jgi:N-acyl-D-amino-acid deacylase
VARLPARRAGSRFLVRAAYYELMPQQRSHAFAVLALLCAAASAAAQSTLITGAKVLDGSGRPAAEVSVRIIGDRIADIGDLHQREGERVIRAVGFVLAPGFIDTHSHADDAILGHRDALADVSQGITTVVVGQDGGSVFPLGDFFSKLERTPAAVNIASYAGHGTIRERVMGADYKRRATPDEIDRMRKLLVDEMNAGALGLSSGLEYDPGIYSDSLELFALTKPLEGMRGRYISHVRSEDRAFWPALAEIIAIGRRSFIPVQVSHIKLGMRSLWGMGDTLVGRLDRARDNGVNITADIYPYTYWHSDLSVLFPSRDFTDRGAAAFALREVVPADGLILTQYDPDPSYVDKTLAQIALLRHEDDTTALMALEQASSAMARQVGHGVDAIIGTGMDERDIATLLRWPWSNICTDGELLGKHPRGFGAFTRVLGVYVRERGVLTLAEAVRKMTTLAAMNVGIPDRGRISPGMYADLVLFDASTVADRATLADPHAVSAGIRAVWVNGTLVYEDGKPTGAFPGRVVRRVVR